MIKFTTSAKPVAQMKNNKNDLTINYYLTTPFLVLVNLLKIGLFIAPSFHFKPPDSVPKGFSSLKQYQTTHFQRNSLKSLPTHYSKNLLLILLIAFGVASATSFESSWKAFNFLLNFGRFFNSSSQIIKTLKPYFAKCFILLIFFLLFYPARNSFRMPIITK